MGGPVDTRTSLCTNSFLFEPDVGELWSSVVWEGGMLAGLLRRSLHEDHHQHVHDHQQSIEEHPTFIRYLSIVAQPSNLLLDSCDLFPD